MSAQKEETVEMQIEGLEDKPKAAKVEEAKVAKNPKQMQIEMQQFAPLDVDSIEVNVGPQAYSQVNRDSNLASPSKVQGEDLEIKIEGMEDKGDDIEAYSPSESDNPKKKWLIIGGVIFFVVLVICVVVGVTAGGSSNEPLLDTEEKTEDTSIKIGGDHEHMVESASKISVSQEPSMAEQQKSIAPAKNPDA